MKLRINIAVVVCAVFLATIVAGNVQLDQTRGMMTGERAEDLVNIASEFIIKTIMEGRLSVEQERLIHRPTIDLVAAVELAENLVHGSVVSLEIKEGQNDRLYYEIELIKDFGGEAEVEINLNSGEVVIVKDSGVTSKLFWLLPE